MRRLRLLLAFSFVTAWFFVAGADCLPALTQPASPDKLSYPATRRVDHVDEYHGVTVADPYRWLEADVRTSPEVAAWVVQQNQVTEAYLKEIPQREALKKRLTEL
jgi:prolyl oligopeptidase